MRANHASGATVAATGTMASEAARNVGTDCTDSSPPRAVLYPSSNSSKRSA